MNRTRIAALLASVALLAPPAFAQQGTAPDGATTTVPPGIPPHTTPTAPDGTSPSTSPTGQVDVQTKPDLGATTPAPVQSDAPTGGTAAPPATATPPAATTTTTPPAAPLTTPPPAEGPAKPAMATGLLAPEGYTQLDDFTAVTAEQLKGAELHSSEGKDIGKVSDLAMDAGGKADGLIADIGGFLGLGSHTVKLTPEQIGIFRNADEKVIVVSSLTEEVLKSLPAWEAPKP